MSSLHLAVPHARFIQPPKRVKNRRRLDPIRAAQHSDGGKLEKKPRMGVGVSLLNETESSVMVRRRTLQAIVATLASSTAFGMVVAQSKAEDSPSEQNDVSTRRREVYHSDEEWKQMLTPNQYAVLRTAATERRFSSPLVDEHRRGTFHCAGCHAPLFASEAKYESGTGWPSFYQALPGAVDQVPDRSIPFMPRTEVRCRRCQGHLGHVFEDGPRPTGLRYCMNGIALTFEPLVA